MKLQEKHKRLAILAGTFLAIVLCYKVAIKSTIDTYSSYKELKRKSESVADLPKQIADFQTQLTQLNKSYFTTIKIGDDTHEIFLDKLGRLAAENKLRITEFPREHVYKTASVQIETHTALLEGSFINLLKVLYQLEVHERIGRLIAVDFYSETNRRTKIQTLHMRVYIQNYRNLKKNETH